MLQCCNVPILVNLWSVLLRRHGGRSCLSSRSIIQVSSDTTSQRKSRCTMRSTRGRPSADKEMALTDAVTASTQVNRGEIDHHDCEGKNHSTMRVPVTRNRPIVSKVMHSVDASRYRKCLAINAIRLSLLYM